MSADGVRDYRQGKSQESVNSEVASSIDTLTAAYAGLTQSDIVVGAKPTTGEVNTIYRVPGTTTYTDWMWNGTSWVEMATYSNAIDDVPTANSNNLVKSGGVYATELKATYCKNVIDEHVIVDAEDIDGKEVAEVDDDIYIIHGTGATYDAATGTAKTWLITNNGYTKIHVKTGAPSQNTNITDAVSFFTGSTISTSNYMNESVANTGNNSVSEGDYLVPAHCKLIVVSTKKSVLSSSEVVITLTKCTFAENVLNDKIDEKTTYVDTFDGKVAAMDTTAAYVKENGELYNSSSAVTYMIQNNGYDRVHAYVGSPAQNGAGGKTYSVAFFSSLEFTTASLIASSSVLVQTGNSNETVNVDVPDGCVMITVSCKKTQLPIGSTVITLYKDASVADAVGDLYTKLSKYTQTNIDVLESKEVEGVISNSFSVDIPNSKSGLPLLVTMESSYSGTQPTMCYTVGGFTSMVFSVGGEQQWRIPAMEPTMEKAVLNFSIANGGSLSVTKFSVCESACGIMDSPIRFDAHLGVPRFAPAQTMKSFMASRSVGFAAIIVTPIRTADGVWMCYHDGSAILTNDGGATYVALSESEFEALDYDEVMDYDVAGISNIRSYYSGNKMPTLEEFLRFCAVTGVKPMFSLHKSLTATQWGEIVQLLKRYNIVDKLTLKASYLNYFTTAIEVLGDDIEGYVYDDGHTLDTESEVYTRIDTVESTLPRGTRNVYELASGSLITSNIVNYIVNKGLVASISLVYSTKPTGAEYWQYIGYGVTEFCEDWNFCPGLMF